MAEIHPIFNDVDRRAIVSEVVEENGTPVLALDALAEDGTRTRVLTLNKFDAKQLSAACDRYMHQQFSVDYSNVNTLLSETDRAELIGDDD
ncbi:hypothetical protein NQ015_10045 [Corynebacterium sp. 153RC1]|uniref:hypothetical protein n=1 Tax=unclassified Corynebacterium TaxID=2624378 RepID=UPI00211C94FE|nr:MULTISPECIES: hypothetical protein [unclassified Corynebacterium]MCQ9371338.1 hypothetical protein [Corynebacterium sp. 35RC1]MCQ9353315.1 hypothetical protein [Corynebacterium sp. 209RC1]MCQ9355570.1 hypothetical protein [Corynebacterium sp. 1222RC1]MCQ9357754.1 hypothetical protein [Corynebacterium sp. 122RC1]MCQ9359959.1 hypothetical protein [Corynebacterium sp. 142RC1]